MAGRLYRLLFGDRGDPRVEIRELFGTEDDPGGERSAIRWGLGLVHSRGVDADDGVRVIRTLRHARPELSLKVAHYLAVRIEQAD